MFEHITFHDWSASRYYIEYLDTVDDEQFTIFGYVDVAAIDEGHLFGSAGTNSDGWTITLDIQEYDVTPVLGQPGVVATFRTENLGLGFWYEAKFWYLDDEFAKWSRSVRINLTASFFFQEERSPGWPVGLHEIKGGSLPECFSFPLIEEEEDFANFNGTNSYIQLEAFTPQIATRWEMSGEMYLRSNLKAWLLVHSSQNLVRAGFSGGLAQYRTSTGAISPPLPLDEWFAFRFEREWTFPTGNFFRLFVNETQVAQFGGVNWALQFDQIGHPRFEEDVPWPNYDLRNFRVLIGTPESPITVLDMPLEVNACDQGADENHGTTFNMALPSCPP